MTPFRAIVCVTMISSALVLFQSCGAVQFQSAGSQLAAANTGGGTPAGGGGNLPPNTKPSPTPSAKPSMCGGDDSTVVECGLGEACMKVVLTGKLLGEPSNSSSSRVCMSKNACLNLINAYAVTHTCTLDAGAATTPKGSGQCTQVFPGSEGTCNNATVLSDAQVNALLATLGQ
jgi:hypothetical protein